MWGEVFLLYELTLKFPRVCVCVEEIEKEMAKYIGTECSTEGWDEASPGSRTHTHTHKNRDQVLCV